jgi:hypothetical protein
MTDAERLRAIKSVFSSAKSTAAALLAIQDILDAAPKISVAQLDPYPLGSVRFDEATEDQFVEFWEAAGFVIGTHAKKMWADRSLNGVTDELTVFQGGMITLWSGDSDIHIASPLTFQEALDALNELAATKIMGGWA